MQRSWVIVVGALALVVGVLGGVVLTRTVGNDGWGPHMAAGRPGPGMMGDRDHRGDRGFGRHAEVMDHAVVRSELDYLAQMIPHHEEAIAAARELQRSDRPELRQFGADIVRTQSQQVSEMKKWLAEWYPGRDTTVDYEPMMRDLSGLTGDRLDRTFLEDMIGHHMAAVMMSQQLLARGLASHDQVSALAESIRDGQHAEIFRMQHWLAQWYGDSYRGWGRGRGGSYGPMGPGMMW
jgi:uncharacterized protein (DUF305 family)